MIYICLAGINVIKGGGGISVNFPHKSALKIFCFFFCLCFTRHLVNKEVSLSLSLSLSPSLSLSLEARNNTKYDQLILSRFHDCKFMKKKQNK